MAPPRSCWPRARPPPGSIYIPPANPEDPNSGMGTDHATQTGIPTGLDALEHDLDGGHPVIVSVNTDETR